MSELTDDQKRAENKLLMREYPVCSECPANYYCVNYSNMPCCDTRLQCLHVVPSDRDDVKK